MQYPLKKDVPQDLYLGLTLKVFSFFSPFVIERKGLDFECFVTYLMSYKVF